MVVLWESHRKTIGKWWLYPLVNVYITNRKDPPFLMGNLTISMAIFHSYVKLPEGKLADDREKNQTNPG